MEISVALISILAITGLMWLFNKVSPRKICPICAGVSGTWLWILAGIWLELFQSKDWEIIAALTMGGSVVGIAYQLEKYLFPRFSPLFWKVCFISVGFLAVYGIISSKWGLVVSALFLLAGIMFIFLRKPIHNKKEDKKIKELEKQMKECC